MPTPGSRWGGLQDEVVGANLDGREEAWKGLGIDQREWTKRKQRNLFAPKEKKWTVGVCDCFYRATLCQRGLYDAVVCLCVSDTRRYCTKTDKIRIIQIIPHDSAGTLEFWWEKSWRNSSGFMRQIYLTNSSYVPNRPQQTNSTSYFTFILISYGMWNTVLKITVHFQPSVSVCMIFCIS